LILGPHNIKKKVFKEFSDAWFFELLQKKATPLSLKDNQAMKLSVHINFLSEAKENSVYWNQRK
jgi:hypothetical protein